MLPKNYPVKTTHPQPHQPQPHQLCVPNNSSEPSAAKPPWRDVSVHKCWEKKENYTPEV